jgi:hypothetical protein
VWCRDLAEQLPLGPRLQKIAEGAEDKVPGYISRNLNLAEPPGELPSMQNRDEGRNHQVYFPALGAHGLGMDIHPLVVKVGMSLWSSQPQISTGDASE